MSSYDEHKILPVNWSRKALKTTSVKKLAAYINELPRTRWALEAHVESLDLLPARAHRLTVFELHGREAFALVRGAGELMVGQVPGEGERAWRRNSVYLDGFDSAWEEVMQILPLPQLYSKAVVLAVVTRRWTSGTAERKLILYRTVVYDDGRLRLVPTIDSQKDKEGREQHVHELPLPFGLESLARFPVETRGTPAPEAVDGFLSELEGLRDYEGRLEGGERPVCAAYDEQTAVFATDYDRLRVLDLEHREEREIRVSSRPVSMDLGPRVQTDEGQPSQYVFLTTEEDHLLAIDMLGPDSAQRTAPCIHDSLVSNTSKQRILLAYADGLSQVVLLDVRECRHKLLRRLAQQLSGDWRGWLERAKLHEVAARVGIWLDYLLYVEKGAPSTERPETKEILAKLEEWAATDTALALGRAFANRIRKWDKRDDHWRLLLGIYEKAAHPFRREIDGMIRERPGAGIEHRALVERAAKSAFDVANDEAQPASERVEAAIDIALNPYLVENTVTIGRLRQSDEVKAVSSTKDDRLVVLTRQAVLEQRADGWIPLGSGSESARASSDELRAPPRFCRRRLPTLGPMIGYENGHLRPWSAESSAPAFDRCVDGFEGPEPGSSFVLRRNGPLGMVEIWSPVTGPNNLLLSMSAPCSIDLHALEHTVLAVVGERHEQALVLDTASGDVRHVFGLPDTPTCVRFTPDGSCLIVGTVNGLVLCFPLDEEHDKRWTYRVRGRVQDIQLRHGRVLVVAPAQEAVILTEGGRRLWRVQNSRIRCATWLSDSRCAVVMRDGQVTILRPTEASRRDDVIQHAESTGRVSRSTITLALGQERDSDVELQTLNRAHRAVWVARLVATNPERIDYRELSARELAVAARHVSEDLKAWEKIWEAATTFPIRRDSSGDHGLSAKTAAIAECLRRVQACGGERSYIVRRLKEIPKVWKSSLGRWLHVIAADLLIEDVSVDWRRVLEDAMTLPPEVLEAAAALRPTRLGPCRAVVRIARVAHTAMDRIEAVLFEFANVLARHKDDLAQVIYPLAELAATPVKRVNWPQVKECIDYARACPPGAGRPLVNLVAAVADSVPSQVPERHVALQNQQEWLRMMLGRRVRLDAGTLEDFYIPIINAWAARLHSRFQHAAQVRLQQLISTMRVRMEWDFDHASLFHIRLVPEGVVTLEDVLIRLTLRVENKPPVVKRIQLARLEPEDPEILVDMELPITHERRASLVIETEAPPATPRDVTIWPIRIRVADESPDKIVAQLPAMFASVIQRANDTLMETVIVAREADLEVIAAALNRKVISDIRGDDWRERFGPGVLYPATRRAQALLARPRNDTRPDLAHVTWLLPAGLGEKLALRIDAKLIRACRVDSESGRNELTAWLQRHGGLSASDAASMVKRTGGDLRVCAAVALGKVPTADAMVEALREDLGGVGPIATAALLGVTGPAVPLIRLNLSRVAPIGPHKGSLEHLGLLRETASGAVEAVEFVELVEAGAGGPSELLRKFAGEAGLWSELPFDRLGDIDAAVLKSLDNRLDDRKVHALRALGRLWSGEGGQRALAAFISAFQGGDVSTNQALAGILNAPAVRIEGPNWQVAFVDDSEHRLDEAPRRPVAVFGPGVHRFERSTNVFPLSEKSLREILSAAHWWRALVATTNAHRDLAAINSFTSHGALEPGSPLFVGRRAIRSDFEQNITRRHFLLLGSRRIGKTSLMNQLYRHAYMREDLHPFWVDGQGVEKGDRLEVLYEGPNHKTVIPKTKKRWLSHLRENIERVRRAGLVPILFLNEIDGLVENDPKFLNELRGEFENGLRMVAVGYSTLARAVRRPEGFLHHLASNPTGKASYNLSVLRSDAAYELVNRLKHDPLNFWWSSDRAESLGSEELVVRSYGIPWLLQDLCSALVDHLIAQQRGVITLNDVRTVVGSVKPLLEYFESTEFEHLLEPHRYKQLTKNQRSQARIFTRFILLVLVRAVYFEAQPPIDFNTLPSQTAAGFRFSAATARALVKGAITSAPCTEPERATMYGHLENVGMGDHLNALCLTLIMESSFEDGQELFAFQGHVYPVELWRAQVHGGRVIEDRILDTLWELVGS